MIIVIPARMASKRLFGKPLAMLGDAPMVVQVAKQAKLCKHVSRIIIATDSPLIVDAAKQYGIEAIMTSAEHTSGSSRVAEVMAHIDTPYVINLQGDEPFINPHDIDKLIDALQHNPCDMVTLKRPIMHQHDFDNPHVVKVVCNKQNYALYFSRAAIPHDGFACAIAHIGVYGFRKHALLDICREPPNSLELAENLEQLRALTMGFRILVIPSTSGSCGIDTADDLAQARSMLKMQGQAIFPGRVY